jgi:hypothetical protein
VYRLYRSDAVFRRLLKAKAPVCYQSPAYLLRSYGTFEHGKLRPELHLVIGVVERMDTAVQAKHRPTLPKEFAFKRVAAARALASRAPERCLTHSSPRAVTSVA